MTRGPEVVAEDLVVTFGRGKRRAFGLNGLKARFEPGITGLVGPNGAGKSTLLRSMCGLLPARSGSLSIAGLDPAAYIATREIGFLPESPPLGDYLTVDEFLSGLPSTGTLRPGPGSGSIGRGPPGLPGLEDLLARRIGALSLGQKKRTALAAALSGNPGLLLLDEPTNGLDPSAVKELREILTGLARTGMTIVVSSHHLDELQRIADVLIFVEGGRTLGAWTRAEALARFGSFEALYEHRFPRRSA